MYCLHCGNQIPTARKFCPFCGSELNIEEDDLTRASAPMRDVLSQYDREPELEATVAAGARWTEHIEAGSGSASAGMYRAADYRPETAASPGKDRAYGSVPDPEISARYEAQYQKFRQIYPAMKTLFRTLSR